MLIQEFAEGCCDKCGQTRKGVRFSFYESGAFLCWEHFRLTLQALAAVGQSLKIQFSPFKMD